MTPFSGTHLSKRDAKGRVSVPAQIRSILKQNSQLGKDSPITPMVLRPSHRHPCIEGWTQSGHEELSQRMAAEYDQFSPEYDDIAMALFGDSHPLESDSEGRIVIPATLLAYAGIGQDLMFIGARDTFQIWEPEAGTSRLAEARQRAQASGFTLRARVPE